VSSESESPALSLLCNSLFPLATPNSWFYNFHGTTKY
jgi:hypothetical protein